MPPARERVLAQHARRELLEWYRRHRRSLPWRERGGAYAVLVSEFMLQQTRVDTVIPYYLRFLDAFPEVERLAAAPVEEVLALWSGLGYYSRARRLHAAARVIVERGAFPRSAAELQTLPGIGAYTAAAIASIAFGEPVAVVDGNVERVVARLLALDDAPGRGAARERVRSGATALCDPRSPGDSNQALMELGATVCLPRRPLCVTCPLQSYCEALAAGRVEELPVRAPRRTPVREQRVVAVARRGERLLLARNPEGSELLAGLWEFPWTVAAGTREELETALASSYGGRWRLGERVGVARHAITYRSIELAIHAAEVRYDHAAEGSERGAVVAEGGPEPGWLTPAEIAATATTSMVRKVLARLARGR